MVAMVGTMVAMARPPLGRHEGGHGCNTRAPAGGPLPVRHLLAADGHGPSCPPLDRDHTTDVPLRWLRRTWTSCPLATGRPVTPVSGSTPRLGGHPRLVTGRGADPARRRAGRAGLAGGCTCRSAPARCRSE